MVIKTKFPYLLLLWFFFTVYFSSGLLSLCYQIPRQRTDVDQCIDQCRQEEKDVPGLFACAARCDRKYAGTTPWEPEGSPGELLKCQKRCEWEESGRRQHQQCKQRCGEEVREREQERQREQVERERENREQKQRERQEREEIEQKREREREQRNREEREQREEEEEEEEEEEIERQREWKREERERDREREREVSPHDYSSRDPEEKLEQCMQLCKKQPARQEPQCKRRCKRQYEGTKRNLQQDLREKSTTTRQWRCWRRKLS